MFAWGEWLQGSLEISLQYKRKKVQLKAGFAGRKPLLKSTKMSLMGPLVWPKSHRKQKYLVICTCTPQVNEWFLYDF